MISLAIIFSIIFIWFRSKSNTFLIYLLNNFCVSSFNMHYTFLMSFLLKVHLFSFERSILLSITKNVRHKFILLHFLKSSSTSNKSPKGIIVILFKIAYCSNYLKDKISLVISSSRKGFLSLMESLC